MTDRQFNTEVDRLQLRYMRGWISLAAYRAALVALYDLADRQEA